MKHIFVVDDEHNIRELIKKYLEKEGYKVTLFSNGNQVFDEIVHLKPDLIVLDIMMDGISGLELCQKIRLHYDLPILFVSARDEEVDRIIGLELGADDYLSKPFSPRELVVRIKNILRRIGSNVQEVTEIKVGQLRLMTQLRRAYIGPSELKLTTKEYDVLEILSKNPKMPFTREQLMERVWGFDAESECRLVDDVVKRLRKKMKEAGSETEITTVWGYGYRIDD